MFYFLSNHSFKKNEKSINWLFWFFRVDLKKQNKFNYFYNSKNINEIKNKNFDLIVCCAPNAEKWIANKEPLKDLNNIKKLIENINHIRCKKFILLSTVDVFFNPIDVDENTLINENKLEPYGLNRRFFEKFIQDKFEDHLIIRLPALVGNGLKKMLSLIYTIKTKYLTLIIKVFFNFTQLIFFGKI